MKVLVDYGDGTEPEELDIQPGQTIFHPYEDEEKHEVTVEVLEEDLPEEAPEEEDVFDPADYTVTQVIGYAEDNPDQIDAIIAAEEAGKNRSTLITQLENLKAQQ